MFVTFVYDNCDDNAESIYNVTLQGNFYFLTLFSGFLSFLKVLSFTILTRMTQITYFSSQTSTERIQSKAVKETEGKIQDLFD